MSNSTRAAEYRARVRAVVSAVNTSCVLQSTVIHTLLVCQFNTTTCAYSSFQLVQRQRTVYCIPCRLKFTCRRLLTSPLPSDGRGHLGRVPPVLPAPEVRKPPCVHRPVETTTRRFHLTFCSLYINLFRYRNCIPLHEHKIRVLSSSVFLCKRKESPIPKLKTTVAGHG